MQNVPSSALYVQRAGFLFVFIPLLRSFSAGPAPAVLPVNSPSPCSSCAFGNALPPLRPDDGRVPDGSAPAVLRQGHSPAPGADCFSGKVFQILHDGLLVNGLTVIAGDVLTLSQMAPMGVLVIEPDLIFSLPDDPPPADGRRDVDLAIPQHTLHPSLAAEGLYLRPGLPIPDAQR